MTQSFREEVYTRLYSSMCFGNVFGSWLLSTIILSIVHGWVAWVVSTALYVAAFVILNLTGHFIIYRRLRK